MKIVFASNYFNHHQKPLSDALYLLTNHEYRFIATQPIEQERLNMGWGQEPVPDYVLYNYTDVESKNECQKIIDEADVVILGNAPKNLLDNRLNKGKLTFRYAERPFKKKPPFHKYLIRFWMNLRKVIRFKNYYILCASAYTAADFAKVFTFIDKTYKWGYFTELKNYQNIEDLIASKAPASILWVARFLGLKHPEHAIEVAKRLKADGYNFKLSMIGSGELEEKIKTSITREDLSDCVELLGTMSPEEVRVNMEKSEIFLFTSDRNEGWGAVLNESMNSACAVVANSAIGSVPFLIKDGENGFMYRDGDVEGIYEKVKKLLDDESERKRLSLNAYKTMTEEWNAENAAKKFLALCEKMLNGEYKPFPFEEGVCSKAERLKDNWFR